MKQYPPTPGVADAPASFFETGHLWIQEQIAGELLRFQLESSGALRLASRQRTFDPGETPVRYRHAELALRDSVSVDDVRDAIPDVESVVFFGIATQYDGIDYEWERLPSVLGIDVWDGRAGEFLSVDATERVFEHVGIDPVNVFRKEVHVRDYDVDEDPIPQSAWYDGPAAGVVLRKKTGERLAVPNPAVGAWTSQDPRLQPLPASPESAAAETATQDRFERIARTVSARDRPVTFDTTYDRFLASIFREHHDWLLDDEGEGAQFDIGAFRDVVAARLSEFLEE